MTALEWAEVSLMECIRQRFTRPRVGGSRILIFAGPPGAGKSTAAQRLGARGFELCLEHPDENPFLRELLAGNAEVAHACQDWFVSEVESFLDRAPRDVSIVLDQDPMATALVYGKALRMRGLLKEQECLELIQRSRSVEYLLSEWGGCDVTFLDAPLDVLERRVRERGRDTSATFWLRELQQRFLAYARRLSCTALDTVELAPNEVVGEIQSL